MEFNFATRVKNFFTPSEATQKKVQQLRTFIGRKLFTMTGPAKRANGSDTSDDFPPIHDREVSISEVTQARSKREESKKELTDAAGHIKNLSESFKRQHKVMSKARELDICNLNIVKTNKDLMAIKKNVLFALKETSGNAFLDTIYSWLDFDKTEQLSEQALLDKINDKISNIDSEFINQELSQVRDNIKNKTGELTALKATLANMESQLSSAEVNALPEETKEELKKNEADLKSELEKLVAIESFKEYAEWIPSNRTKLMEAREQAKSLEKELDNLMAPDTAGIDITDEHEREQQAKLNEKTNIKGAIKSLNNLPDIKDKTEAIKALSAMEAEGKLNTEELFKQFKSSEIRILRGVIAYAQNVEGTDPGRADAAEKEKQALQELGVKLDALADVVCELMGAFQGEDKKNNPESRLQQIKPIELLSKRDTQNADLEKEVKGRYPKSYEAYSTVKKSILEALAEDYSDLINPLIEQGAGLILDSRPLIEEGSRATQGASMQAQSEETQTQA